MRHHIGMTCQACGGEDHDITIMIKETRETILPEIEAVLTELESLLADKAHDPTKFIHLSVSLAMSARVLESISVVADLAVIGSLRSTSCQN